MIKAWQIVKSNRGAALMTGIMVLMMVAMFGLAYLALTSTNLMRAGRDERRATAFYLAEAGLEYVIAQITNDAETNGGVVTAWNYDSTSLLDSLHSGATGSVMVTPGPGGNTYGTVISSATYRGITETVRMRLRVKDIGIWSNAIFAGAGQAGRGINGNVDIRGSVHILGEGDPFSDLNGNGQWDPAEPFTDSNGNAVYDPGEPYTDSDGNGLWGDAEPFQDENLNGVYDPPLTATDLATTLTGNAHIGNNYSGIPADLLAKIPSLVPQNFGGETIETLNAEVRVKHGKVNLSGSATIGNPNVTGNGIKETIDGCYVTDGYGGNQGTNNVYSDNGTGQGYDLGDRVSFPSLLNEYTDPDTGIYYSTFENYLVANSAVIPVSTINASTPAFSVTDGTNSVSWDPDTNTLSVTGIARVTDTLDLIAKDYTLNVTGRGTIFAQGDITVHGNLKTVNTFPTVDSIGFIAKRNINLATGPGESQITAMGAWYAQGEIVSAKQSQFAGTYVANFFNMGSQVPNIYQVPSLADNLPPGMPGGQSHVVTESLSWRHL